MYCSISAFASRGEHLVVVVCLLLVQSELDIVVKRAAFLCMTSSFLRCVLAADEKIKEHY